MSFALAPGRLGIGIGIGATVHHFGDALPKAAADFFQHGRSAAILNDIVQERGDREIFVAARFKHQGRDSHQVRDVGNGRCLASLAGMLLGGE